MSKIIPGNQKHLSCEDRHYIEESLNNGVSFKDIAKYLCKDPTTISKEVKSHRQKTQRSPWGGGNICAKVKDCDLVNVCRMHLSCGRLCKKCKSCNSKCPEFQPKLCPKNSHAPFVCNSCSSKQKCMLVKYYYRADIAHSDYKAKLVSSREGINLSDVDFMQLDSLVSPLIQKGQPLAHIFSNHEADIPCSRRTIYNYLANNTLTARNIDLPRRVRYKPRRHHEKPVRREFSWLEGRRYGDFIEFITLHPETSVVEMDTVEGTKGGKVLLTFLFRQSHLMIAFLLKNKTQEEVLRILNSMEKAIGTICFRKTFPVILTDNGSEFINPELIETGIDGAIRTSVYYCDPRASYQKGGLERNHEFIRYFSPQGKSLDDYTQFNINRMINNINNTARDGLNGRTPYELASLLMDKCVLEYLNLYKIEPDDVSLRPTVLKEEK